MAEGGFELIESYHSHATMTDILYLKCDNCGTQFKYETYKFDPKTPVCPECGFPNDQGTCMESFIRRVANDI